MTRISGNDQSPSFFTTSCLRLQFGQCHASSAPNTSARVYSWNDKYLCLRWIWRSTDVNRPDSRKKRTVPFSGTCGLHFQGDSISFRWMLQWSGRVSALLTYRGCKNLGQSQPWKGEHVIYVAPSQCKLRVLSKTGEHFLVYKLWEYPLAWYTTYSCFPFPHFWLSKILATLLYNQYISSSQPLQHAPEPNWAPWTRRRHIPLKC
jgi:hypothetical protein